MGIIGWVGSLLKDAPCEKCEIYKEFLHQETERREYYEKLLLLKAGVIRDDIETALDVSSYPSVRRAATLSSIRRMAINISQQNKKSDKQAVDKFEKSLAEAKDSK